MSIPFDRIKAAALASIESVLGRWLPNGKRQGREYLPLNPKRSDSKAGSFSINIDTGAWSDFATGDKGGDLVSLVAYIEGEKQTDAAKRLADFLGLPAGTQAGQTKAASKAGQQQESWRPIQPVPANAPPPPKVHPRHGTPSMSWTYHDQNGQVLCWVYRFEAKTESERKQFFPLTYCDNGKGKQQWRWQGLPDPRPLYNLHKLTANHLAPVIVCEGEKAAEAATQLFPDAICTTMLNGSQSPHKSDWTPVSGRVVWLWPDNDAAGLDCMSRVEKLARQAGAAHIEQFDLAQFAQYPHTNETGSPVLEAAAPVPEKWDAADAVAGGWTAAHIALLDKLLIDAPQQTPNKQEVPTLPDPETPQTRYHVNDQGVWYFGKNDNGTEAPPLWVCSKLEVTASTRDAKNESWGRLLEFNDPDGVHHAWAMPLELLKGDGAEYRGVLLSMGLQMSTMTKARNLLTQYIQTAPIEARARCVERTGWHSGVFVMPQHTIGAADERILYQSAASAPNTFKQRGKLTDWQKNVAALCGGNSRLVFAISTALAAPLLEVTGMESGGFHFRGDSSTGKTTALRVAASVWGGPEYLQRWRATDNGLEALAAQHSDCLLVLDEISQVDPRAVGDVAYMLANGSGKARAGRTGAIRDTASWRLLFISSGEAGLAEHMALANQKPKAGQEIRLLDIPAEAGAGHGVFDTLHDYSNGAVFSKALVEATAKHYGQAALAFIEALIPSLDKIPSRIRKAQQEFIQAHMPEDAGGQANRAALRFALVAAAGEMATSMGVTGWQQGEAHQAAATCFKAWLAQRGGAGNQEAAAMLAQVRQFFELHGDARFTCWERVMDDHAPKTVNRAGFRKFRDLLDSNNAPIWDEAGKRIQDTEFYVLPEVFKAEVCKGFDPKTVAKLLADKGYLQMDGRQFTRKERLPGMGNIRCYRINSKLMADN